MLLEFLVLARKLFYQSNSRSKFSSKGCVIGKESRLSASKEFYNMSSLIFTSKKLILVLNGCYSFKSALFCEDNSWISCNFWLDISEFEQCSEILLLLPMRGSIRMQDKLSFLIFLLNLFKLSVWFFCLTFFGLMVEY